MDERIRVLLADDHETFRKSIRKLFELDDQIEVLAECKNGLEAVEVSEKYKPDVIMMDIHMPVCNGVEATRRIKSRHPHTKIIIVSIHDDESYIAESLLAGANGYLLKDSDSQTLLRAVKGVMEGEAFIHPQVTGKLLESFRKLNDRTSTNDPVWNERLTQREREIIQLMGMGMSNRGIGEQLFISEKTVKNHVSRILSKLEVEDRTQVVIHAAKKGWIQL